MCTKHNMKKHMCLCEPPFKLYAFPTEKNDPHRRLEWAKIVYRVNPETGRNWKPGPYDRICSQHFVNGKPTPEHPNPSLNLGHRGKQHDKH